MRPYFTYAAIFAAGTVLGAYILSSGPTPNMTRIWGVRLDFYPTVRTTVRMEQMVATDAVTRTWWVSVTNGAKISGYMTSTYAKVVVSIFPMMETVLDARESDAMASLTVRQLGLGDCDVSFRQMLDGVIRAGLKARGMNVSGGDMLDGSATGPVARTFGKR